jgi:hypothetical protein
MEILLCIVCIFLMSWKLKTFFNYPFGCGIDMCLLRYSGLHQGEHHGLQFQIRSSLVFFCNRVFLNYPYWVLNQN